MQLHCRSASYGVVVQGLGVGELILQLGQEGGDRLRDDAPTTWSPLKIVAWVPPRLGSAEGVGDRLVGFAGSLQIPRASDQTLTERAVRAAPERRVVMGGNRAAIK